VEWALLVPVVIVLLLLVVAFGRVAHARQLVQSAAAAAARSASLAATPTDAAARAQRSAGAALTDAGVSCAAMTAQVDTAQFRAGGQVRVTVSCTADLSGLALAGVPGRLTLTESAGSPLETYRQFSLGFSNSEGGTTP
jgi:Flp pilus assembly protein TadG